MKSGMKIKFAKLPWVLSIWDYLVPTMAKKSGFKKLRLNEFSRFHDNDYN